VRFHERQRLRHFWLVALVAAMALLAWATLVQQIVRGKPVGTNPMSDWGVIVVWFLMGVGLPLARSVVTVPSSSA
jgi:hypothetical protein